MIYYIFNEYHVGVSFSGEIPEGAVECDESVYRDSEGYAVIDGVLSTPSDDKLLEIEIERSTAYATNKKNTAKKLS